MIQVAQTHRLSHRAAQRQVNQVLKGVRDEMDITIIPRWNERGTRATATGTGFKATLENNPGEVRINVELSLLLLAFEGRIKAVVCSLMAKHLRTDQGRTDDRRGTK